MQGLTPKQAAFIEAYCNNQSETFGNASKSYVKAGYKPSAQDRQNACRLVTKSYMKQAITDYAAKNETRQAYTADIVRQRIDETWQMAKAKGDIPCMIQSARLQAQEQAMLTDKLRTSTDDAQKPQFDPEQIEQMLADAKYITDNKPNIKLNTG